jgi:hypothetical protein
MTYFSRRNEYITEYSGHEEISSFFRERLFVVVKKFVNINPVSYSADDPWSVEHEDFIFETNKEFPNKDPFSIIRSGLFHEVFTVVEIFLDLAKNIYYTRRNDSLLEVFQAFQLSGSV